jgi:hypothetical protein
MSDDGTVFEVEGVPYVADIVSGNQVIKFPTLLKGDNSTLGPVFLLQGLLNAAPDPGPHLRDEANNHGVDTCLVPDTGRWETAVWVLPDAGTAIVELYDTAEAAGEGHLRWVATVAAGAPDQAYETDPRALDTWLKFALEEQGG